MSALPHSRLLNEAATNLLAKIGMFRKGRSRIWLDDRGWWISIVEFQPSSWSKGSYLNVGAMWLWHDQAHFSYDFGGRVNEFVAFQDEEQFAADALRLASIARDRVLEQRKGFRSCSDVAKLLVTKKVLGSPWRTFHIGAAYGYSGNLKKAKALFTELSNSKAEFDWEKDLAQRARHLAELISTPIEFRKDIEETIVKTRRNLKLPAISSLGIV